MPDIEPAAGGDITRGGDSGEPLGGANDGQRVQRVEGAVAVDGFAVYNYVVDRFACIGFAVYCFAVSQRGGQQQGREDGAGFLAFDGYVQYGGQVFLGDRVIRRKDLVHMQRVDVIDGYFGRYVRCDGT